MSAGECWLTLEGGHCLAPLEKGLTNTGVLLYPDHDSDANFHSSKRAWKKGQSLLTAGKIRFLQLVHERWVIRLPIRSYPDDGFSDTIHSSVDISPLEERSLGNGAVGRSEPGRTFDGCLTVESGASIWGGWVWGTRNEGFSAASGEHGIAWVHVATSPLI